MRSGRQTEHINCENKMCLDSIGASKARGRYLLLTLSSHVSPPEIMCQRTKRLQL